MLSAKGQVISEQNCGVLNFPKKQQNSALASKMRQIKKINAHYQQPRKDSKQIFLKLISNQSIYSDNLKKV